MPINMSNQTYDVLKWVITVILPAIGALYSGLAILWGFPYGEEVVGTIALLVTAGSTILGLSSRKYQREFEEAA